MLPADDTATLMRKFCETESPDAFRELVNRYLPLVFCAAMRRSNGDESLAQDVSQLVFADFARRLPRLRADDRIGGWLYRAALQRTSDVLKSERRRKRREKQAAAMQENDRTTGAEGWEMLSPVIDQAMEGLRPTDREILVLRFFEGMKSKAIARSLDVTEEAAQKRVERALGRLRSKLRGTGIPVGSATVLGGLMASGGSIQAAELEHGVVEQVSAAALGEVGAGGAGGAGLTNLISVPLTGLTAVFVLGLGSAQLAGKWSMPDSDSKEAAPRVPGDQRLTALVGIAHGKRMPEESASFEEIMDVLGKILAKPLTSLDEARCRVLFNMIPAGRCGEALLMADEKWTRVMRARADDLGRRAALLDKWGQLEPESASEWYLGEQVSAYNSLQNAMWGSALRNVLVGWAHRDWDGAWAWVSHQIGAEEGSSGHRGVPEFARVFAPQLIERLGLKDGVNAMIDLHELGHGNGMNNIVGAAGEQLKSSEGFVQLMEIISERMGADAGRSVVVRNLLGRWGNVDWDGAFDWVRSIPSDGRQAIYGWELGFPREPGSDRKAHADWLYSLDPEMSTRNDVEVCSQIMYTWFKDEPQAAADWLLSHESVMVGNLVKGALFMSIEQYAVNPGDTPNGWNDATVRLLQRIASRAGLSVESLADESNYSPERRKAIDAFLKSAAESK